MEEGNTALSLNCVSKWVAAKYCHPWFHSPGSFWSRCSGRAPSQTSLQVGQSWYPALRTTVWACSAAAMHWLVACVPSSCSKSLVASSGFLALIMGRVSAHDAQYAAGDVLSADLKPQPPKRSGSCATRAALQSVFKVRSSLPKNAQRVCHTAVSWATA